MPIAPSLKSFGRSGLSAPDRAQQRGFRLLRDCAGSQSRASAGPVRELVERGVVGAAAPRHFSIMGSIIAPGQLIKDRGPEIARKLLSDAVDAVLLAPVCPFCHQASGLLQSVMEKAGIPTVSISLLLDITKRVEPPRVLALDEPPGYPLGKPCNPDFQRRIMLAAFDLLPKQVPEPLIVPFLSEPASKGRG